ncbi:MAG: beta-propeller domain-containing protein [Pseudomonadota bacterium]
MKFTTILSIAFGATFVCASAHAGWFDTPAPPRSLSAFSSEAELQLQFKVWQRRLQQARPRSMKGAGAVVAMEMASQPALSQAAPPVAVSEAKAAADSVTNNQTAGVDEGGIVKVHGKHLVVLRRGRLFTVAIGDRQLRPVAAVDAYRPDVQPGGAWYDELLISGDTVVVIGYSYSGGGTELAVFQIDEAGGLRYRSTSHLRSNDYYSSRNYASRLIGSKLIFYSPLYLNIWQDDLSASLPAQRKWRGDSAGSFQRIAPATRIYRAADELDPAEGIALHTVTVCDLAKPEIDCQATGVLGASGRVFYVSAQAVYIWTVRQHYDAGATRAQSALVRLPLDGSAPTALRTQGAPLDQFSFQESEGYLNVLLQDEGQGEAMWSSERGLGKLALLHLPLSQMGDGRASAPSAYYRPLPGPTGYVSENRYVGHYLLYGAADPQGAGALYALNLANRRAAVQTLALPHAVERIEALGAHALVVGAQGSALAFTSIRLGDFASVGERFERPNAAQGETRSHGFFYRPESDSAGMLGLPVLGSRVDRRGVNRESAAVLFLKNADLNLSMLGTLHSGADGARDDACVASCVDWYGNARPLFIGERVFALMGYELVEGRIGGAGRGAVLGELRRVNFAPGTARAPLAWQK